MNYKNYTRISTWQIDGYTFDDWCQILINADKMILLEVPCSSWGGCNSNLDIANDYYVALILGESIAEYCEEISSDIDNSSIQFLLQARDITGLAEKLAWYSQLTQDEYDEFYSDFNLEERTKIYFPDLADSFLANYIAGEDDLGDEYVEELHQKYPERRHEFWKSFASLEMGYEFYVSQYSWIVPLGYSIKELLKKHGGFKDGLPALEEAEYLSLLNLSPIVFNRTSIVKYPLAKLDKAQKCAEDVWSKSFTLEKKDGGSIIFGKNDKIDNILINYDYKREITEIQKEIKQIFLSKQGNVLILCDSVCQYVFFRKSIELLKYEELEKYLNVLSKMFDGFSEITVPWNQLNDEQFEELCYDIICYRYNPAKIRKMGKSRSRDGGRDIEFQESDRLGQSPIKWIAQCKLIRDESSLTTSKVSNIMDTVDQYGANGFCIMTSGVIDSGLYDRLDGIKRNRGIEIDSWSRLEIERFLAKHPKLRDRYFSQKFFDSKAIQNQALQLNLLDISNETPDDSP